LVGKHETKTRNWEENQNSPPPTVIYIPWLSRLDDRIVIESLSDKIEIEQLNGCDAGKLIIKPTGKAGTRHVNFSFKIT
jgi:hypothetical protein